MNAGLELIEQGNGYVVVRANDIKPTVDLPIYLTYGANITIVPSPEYVGEANRHVDTVAYASRWTKVPDGWEQEVDVEGITSNSIGSMGLRNGCTELQAHNATIARIKITKVYDNKVLLTATRVRPAVNIPLSFVFGRNFNLIKYPGVVGKVTLDCNYIIFDDSLINSGLTTLQQLLEYLQKTKVNKADISNRVHDGDLVNGFETKKYIPEETDSDWSSEAATYKPLSARMGRYLFLRKINYDDIVDNTTSTAKDAPLSANMGKHLEDVKINYNDIVDNLTTPDNRKPLSANMGKVLKDTLESYNNALNGRIDDLTEQHTTDVANINNTINEFKQQNQQDHTDINNTINEFKQQNQQEHTDINNKITQIRNDIGNTIIKIQSTKPSAVSGKNVIWIKI